MKVESSSRRLISEDNTVNNNLPPKIDLFLQDIAQRTEAISYDDISKINPKDLYLMSKLRNYSKWATDIDLIPEEHLRKSGVDLDDEDAEDKLINYLGKLVKEAISGKVESKVNESVISEADSIIEKIREVVGVDDSNNPSNDDQSDEVTSSNSVMRESWKTKNKRG